MFNFFNTNKKIEEYEMRCNELEKREQMFHTLLDTTPLCIKWFDNSGNLISVNKGGREEHFLEDKTDDEIKNWDYFSCIEPKYHETIKKAMGLALKGTRSGFEMEHVPGTAKGHWCMSSLEPVFNKDNKKVEYVMFVSRDITKEKMNEKEHDQHIKEAEGTKNALYNILEDTKEAEMKAKEERDHSMAIISSMGEGIFQISADHKIVLMNKKAKELLDITENDDDVIGKNIIEIFVVLKGDKILSEKERPGYKVIAEGESISINTSDDYYYQTKKGKKFPVGLNATPLKRYSTTTTTTDAIVVFRDLTNEKNLDKAKSSFISIASHQLRIPLTSMRWISELFLTGDVGRLTPKQNDFMNDIHSGSVKLLELISALLSISRIEAGRINIEPTLVDTLEITKDAIRQLENIAKHKQISINLNSEKSLPKINLSSEFFQQAVMNLLSNSINYTPNGGKINITLKAQNNKEKNIQELLFSIKDNGIGIPKQDQEHIYEKFHRADNAISFMPSGTGLGLNLVQSIVKMWNGKIWFESPPSSARGADKNKGTEFFFTVPLAGMKPQKGEVELLT